MKNKRYLAGPYLFWSISFVVIPLLVVFYYAMRERGRRYRFIFDIPDGDGCGTKEAVLGSYVRSLEAVVRRYPQQWFNFYRFWS